MVAVLLALVALVASTAWVVAKAVAGGSALLPVGASIVSVGSGLGAPMCGDARRRLELAAGAP